MRRIVVPIVVAALSPACTPLGLWIYEEPTVEVTEVKLEAGADFPVQIAFAVSNANDFEVSLLRVYVRCSLSGSSLVDRDLATAASFGARDRQIVRIGVAQADLAPGANPGGAASQQYTIDGFAILKTPIGERRIPFTRTGTSLTGQVGMVSRPS